jgi:glutamate synthase (NADPH/NADH) small chain
MPSKCPKCHQIVENEIVCCAEVRYTWKCKACGKLSTGFVVPYGRCFLCGGENEVVKGHGENDPAQVAVVREAMQFELDMFHFYRLAMKQTGDEELRGVLEELYHKEEDHLSELENKYHVHLDASLRDSGESSDKLLSKWIFEGIDLSDAEKHVLALYDRAIEMERRTRDHFKMRAAAMPPGAEKELFRELAAEEEDHVAVLETERSQFAP